ncbi:arrestin [Xylariales sp. AK1849]|nr:arrestin [Xylariales sp. AK1849]
MGASDRAADLSLDDGSSKKSLFSLLSLPLRSRTRNRNLAEFYVQLDEPHRQYSAGDNITGSVILSIIKPVRVTHLTVCLHGFVRVFKNAAQLSAVNPAVVSSDGSKSFRYFGNGHAQLFQDEQVLCGEGRLGARRWEFKFDLIFPSKGLPSSIDFERGTISYMITATLTRPTSIAPTTSAERKVSLIEKVDIGVISPPRERKVTMHAMHKRQRRKKAAVSTTTPTRGNTAIAEAPEPASDLDSTRANENSHDSSVQLEESAQLGQDGLRIPRSPIHSDIQSEISADSAHSNSVRCTDACGASVTGSRVSGGAVEDREITATVEPLKGGCLPGDLLPVRIRVDHNRRMKSMHGIIVTFYRQGRVDYAPPTSHFTHLSEEDARKLEREEVYPRSRTGLGGLSLSSAGSCSVFRKDLSQTVAPLIIDPMTLSANITTSVRVPEDVFPSIKGIPGGLISFKYHVEVVVDLGGRLAGQLQGGSQQSARLGSVSVGGPGSASADGQPGRLANWNGMIVDTDHLRREKGVISVSYEVVVGNVDSNRSRGKSVVRPSFTLQPPSEQEYPGPTDDMNYAWQDGVEPGDYDDDGNPWMPYDQSQSHFPSDLAHHAHYHSSALHDSQPAPVYIPPPQLPDQNELSEKERVRHAEQRLLPSHPTMQPSESEAGPSQRSAPSGALQPNNLPSVSTVPAIPPQDDNGAEEPSAPTLGDLSGAPHSNSTDDKQELERRRLMVEASAPPQIPDDYESNGPSVPLDPAGPRSHEPSAPMLNEHGLYGAHDRYESTAGPSTARSPHGHDHRGEPLPRYER